MRKLAIGVLLAALVAPSMPGVATANHAPKPEEGLVMRLGVELRTPNDLPHIEELASGRPFRVRVPLALGDDPATIVTRTAAIQGAVAEGFEVVVSLRIGDAVLPDDFAAWVGGWAAEFGDLPGVSFDVTNRVNAIVADEDADHHPLGVEALIAGVIAADAATDAPVSFSWVATGVRAYDIAWWTRLGAEGGDAFRAAVDRVGMQFFPSVHNPVASYGRQLGPNTLVREELIVLRTELMRLAGFGWDVPIAVTAFGFPVIEAEPYPVRPATVFENWLLRTTDNQARLLNEMLDGIGYVAEPLGVESALWSRLADPEACSTHGCFGLLTHDRGLRTAFHELAANQLRTAEG